MQEVDGKTYDKDLSGLFKDYQWNYMPDAILEGSMGSILIDDLDNPQVSILTIPEAKANFLGGDAKHPAVRDYLKELPAFSVLIFASEGWNEVVRDIHPKTWLTFTYFGFSSKTLNIEHLRELRSGLSDEFHIEKIDLALAQRIMEKKDELTEDQLMGFDSPEDFVARGIGYCALAGDEMVSIAAAGSVCKKGIEVQINTRKKYKKRGLATGVASALIIDCLEKGIDPNWDAASEASAGLAKKLGYTPTGEHFIYIFIKYRFLMNLRAFLRKIRGKEASEIIVVDA